MMLMMTMSGGVAAVVGVDEVAVVGVGDVGGVGDDDVGGPPVVVACKPVFAIERLLILEMQLCHTTTTRHEVIETMVR